MSDETERGEPVRPLRVALSVYRGNPYCGGQGVYVRHLSRELTALGHSVTVFSGQPYPHLDAGVALERIPSLDLYRDADPFRRPRLREIESVADALELATMWSGGFGEPRTFSLRLRDALLRRVGDFDVLHDDQSLGSALVDLARAGLPVVASVHHPITVDRDLDLEAAPNLGRRLGLRRWYGFARMQAAVARQLPAIITVSEAAKRDLVAAMGVDASRVSIVPIGVDTARYRPMLTRRRVPGRIVTTTSSDVPLKGLGVLLEALAKSRTEIDAHLVVVGRLRPGGQSAQAIERLGLADAVSVRESLSDEEVVATYASASVAVVPSRYEGFSLPAVEAMACGVPLVTTDGGALREVVGDAAVVVPAGDPGALASAIVEVLGEADLARRLGRAGLARAGRFSWAETARQTAAIYASVLGRPC